MHKSLSLANSQWGDRSASVTRGALYDFCKRKTLNKKFSKVFIIPNNFARPKLTNTNVLFISNHNQNRYLLKTLLGNNYSLTSVDDPIIGLAHYIRSLHQHVIIDVRSLKTDSPDIIKEIRRLSVVNKIYSKIIIIYSEDNNMFKLLKRDNLGDLYIKNEPSWHEKLFYLHMKNPQKYLLIK